MAKRPKLNLEGQIAHMRDTRGIKFEIMDADQALQFLKENNFYFKLKAYAKVYGKRSDGKYKDLEFAYLVELSRIDALLRKEILGLTLDVEHYLKTKFIADISECDPEFEDGYQIVDKFMSFEAQREKKINDKGLKSTCASLVKKYREDYAVWQLVELLDFNDFLDLYNYFYCTMGACDIFPDPYSGLLHPVKFLRNAAAHNNCLIIHLKDRGVVEHVSPKNKNNLRLNSIVGQIHKNQKGARLDFMKNTIIHDFIALLVVYNKLAPENSRKMAMRHLEDVFEGRMVENKDYFIGNGVITSSYAFVKTALDYYAHL